MVDHMVAGHMIPAEYGLEIYGIDNVAPVALVVFSALCFCKPASLLTENYRLTFYSCFAFVDLLQN
jgi:hypothetical protein